MKPRTVALEPPVLVIVPLSVALESVRDEADWVVRVGLHADVSNERIDPYPVPAEFVVYARK